jgi:uncharacterized protein (UPF0548 family)
VAELRIGRGWTDRELEERLAHLRNVANNFPEIGPESQQGTDWRRYYTESVIGKETPGALVPGGSFEIARRAISEYQFSDPAIVMGHFSPKDPVEGRTMALEIKILGLHYLCGVRIAAVRENETASEISFAFRYDTLEGHMEIGSEWFTLTKHKETGEIWFRISASWRPGKFPNWWSEVGFHVLSQRYQLAWHRLAYLRLRDIVGSGGLHLVPVPHGKNLVHTGPEISNSDIWILNKTNAAARVFEVSKADPAALSNAPS